MTTPVFDGARILAYYIGTKEFQLRKKRRKSQRDEFNEFVQELIRELQDANQKYSLKDLSAEDPLVKELRELFSSTGEIDGRLGRGEILPKEEIIKIAHRADMFKLELKARFG